MRFIFLCNILLGLSLTALLCNNALAETLKLSPSDKLAVPFQSKGSAGIIDPVSPSEPVKLKTEKHGVIEANLFRQLLPQRYPKYEEKTRSVRNSLRNASLYLKSLDGNPVSLQRLSAFSSETWLDWQQLEKIVTSDERQYRTYQLIEEAVTTLRSLSQYWVVSERTRRTFRSTAKAEALDNKIMESKRKAIEEALNNLEQFEILKAELNSELP